jgi:hypothetical protein
MQTATIRAPGCMLCAPYHQAVREGKEQLTTRTLAYLDGTMDDDEAADLATYKAVRNRVDQYLKTTYGGAIGMVQTSTAPLRRLKVAGAIAATVARTDRVADGMGVFCDDDGGDSGEIGGRSDDG